MNLDVKRKLHITTNLVALKPGKFNFGFKFKAPNTIAPSFEFPGPEGNAYIRYIMSANIISPYIKGTTQIYVVFKTRQKIEMNKQISFVSENNVHKWGLFDGGTTIMKVTSTNGTDNFKFGEDVKFKLNIDVPILLIFDIPTTAFVLFSILFNTFSSSISCSKIAEVLAEKYLFSKL